MSEAAEKAAQRVQKLDPENWPLPPPPHESAPEKPGNGSTTTVAGKTKWGTCWRQACFLAKYIYKDPAPTGGFKTQFPEKMAEVEKHWEIWDSFETSSAEDFGLVARLFKPRGYNPDDPGNACPPTLAFRGTDFDDFRDIAIFAPIRLAKGVWWTFLEKPILRDPAIPENATQEDLEKQGFESPIHFSESGKVRVRGAEDGMSIELKVTVTLRVMTKKKGDWTTNILQGTGKTSEQYKEAIEYGKKVISDKISLQKDKRLEITGHSLGGGLASAVCIVLCKQFPSVSTHAIVFNPAGVHENTVKPAAKSDGQIDIFATRDEVLTTVSNAPGRMPVVGAIFNLAKRYIGQYGLPPTPGTLLAVRACSSGEPLVSGKYNYAKWQELPILFPIKDQTLLTVKPDASGSGTQGKQKAETENQGQFPVIGGIDDAIKNAQTVSQIGEAIIDFIVRRYESQIPKPPERPWYRKDQDIKDTYNYYEQFYGKAKEEADAEFMAVKDIFMACIDYHDMDIVIASYLSRFGG